MKGAKLEFLIISVLTISCISDKSKVSEQENELHTQVSTLKKDLHIQKSINDSLSNFNKRIIKFTGSIYNIIKSDYIPKKYASLFLDDELKFIIDKKQMIQFFFDDFNLTEYDVNRGIANSTLVYDFNENSQKVDSKQSYFTYITSKINRSPESLHKIITPNTKQIIYSLFENNNLYEDSGSEALVKALLSAYIQLENQEEILSQIYVLASKSDYDQIINFASEKVKEMLTDKNYSNYPETRSNTDSRLIIVYSFGLEGINKEYAYSLLKEFHENVSKKIMITREISIDKNTTDRKLQFLFHSNGGVIGYFNDGTIAGCPRCDPMNQI